MKLEKANHSVLMMWSTSGQIQLLASITARLWSLLSAAYILVLQNKNWAKKQLQTKLKIHKKNVTFWEIEYFYPKEKISSNDFATHLSLCSTYLLICTAPIFSHLCFCNKFLPLRFVARWHGGGINGLGRVWRVWAFLDRYLISVSRRLRSSMAVPTIK